MNADGDPPLRPPVERRAASAVGWIAGTLLVIAALVFAWDPPPNRDPAASMTLPSLPSLPDPASPSPGSAREEAGTELPATAPSGTELIEVCGVGWVAPDATGAADLAAVAADRDVLASQRAVLDALRRRDGELGDATATVLELFGAGHDNTRGTPWMALLCASTPSSTSRAPACAGRDEDRQLAKSLVDRLAKLATTTRDPSVYALAMQQCQWVKGDGNCALLNFDQWARVDDGNALPWLYILQRALERNDAAQIDEALYHIGAATRYEAGPYAMAGKIADRAGTSDVDVIAALLMGVEAVGAASLRSDQFTGLTQVCKGSSLADANRRQACEHAVETLTEHSDSLPAIVTGAAIGRRLGWPADRVDKLRGLQLAAAEEARSITPGVFEVPSSCSSARRILASFSRKAREGEAQTARAWVASHGGSAAFVAPPPNESTAARGDDAVPSPPTVAQAATDAASAAVAPGVVAPPAPGSAASSAPAPLSAEAASAASSFTPYSANPPPDR